MELDPLDTDALERARAEQVERQRLRARVDKDDLVWLMSTKQGRRVVARWIGESGPMRSIWAERDDERCRNEGWRNFGLKLTAEVQAACYDKWLLMLSENRE